MSTATILSGSLGSNPAFGSCITILKSSSLSGYTCSSLSTNKHSSGSKYSGFFRSPSIRICDISMSSFTIVPSLLYPLTFISYIPPKVTPPYVPSVYDMLYGPITNCPSSTPTFTFEDSVLSLGSKPCFALTF